MAYRQGRRYDGLSAKSDMICVALPESLSHMRAIRLTNINDKLISVLPKDNVAAVICESD